MRAGISVLLFCILCSGLVIGPFNHHKSVPSFTNENIIDAIVGESASEPLEVKICVACAIRNRGTLRGVYGFHAKHNTAESVATWADAAEAWYTVKNSEIDIVQGAKNFGSFQDIHLHGQNPVIKKACGNLYFY